MEVSSHALCLHRVAGLTFRVGAFTNLTRDHLDFHGTMEAYRRAKGKLFSQSEVALLNIDDPAGEYYVKEISCPVMTYAAARPADLTARGAEFSSNGVRFQAGLGEEIARVHVAIPGAFTVSNALCVLGCARCLGIPLREGAKALHHAAGPRGRMEVASWPGPGTVVIDYAHTPDALENALAALRPFTPGRLICLFGCGGDRDRTKRPIMGAIAARLADICVVTSDNPRSEPPEDIISEILAGMPAAPLPVVEPDRPHAIRAALAMLKEGDTLLLAGKGHETYQEVNGVQYPMDEREIIAAARP
jgi:UDP-N-acetylmuramoyl-L-alanyl-D-glutamate--2,6-diaminopimelate ligase